MFRDALEQVKVQLDKWFEENRPVRVLIETLTEATDLLITRVWAAHVPENASSTLLAVGGYGREALHPGSDIDILVLLEADAEAQYGEAIGRFLTFLWDMGLDLGSSVRSVNSCIEEGAGDLTIATTFFEARMLAGSEPLYQQFNTAINTEDFWPSLAFFKAKLEEQKQRHARFGDTAYRIEPNLKESPGGLRDTHMISWIVARHFGVQTLHDLVEVGFLTEDEFEVLNQSRDFLWRLRYCLHRSAGRKEDRLLLQHQKRAAAAFGFNDSAGNLAVEQFMKQYFRGATDIRRLNEMLLQLFEEQITLKNILADPVELNERFQSRNGYIELKNNELVSTYPPVLLELFLLLQQTPELAGVRATTIRTVRSNLHLIDDDFRSDPRCQKLFMQILAQPRGVYHALKRMNTYGVLAAYLPEFSAVVGLMQFDLFHAYTVDEHTIRVLRFARRLSVAEFSDEEPLCTEVFQQIREPVLLYVACFFHDIAKGREGDHSELGMVDAREFCRRHEINSQDTELVCWLVKTHLLMSLVSQRKDISDSDVINEFIAEVKSIERLNYLYLLTVSDIRGTSPGLWNAWKSGLMANLYRASAAALQAKNTEESHAGQLLKTSSEALQKLLEFDISQEKIQGLWNTLDEEYFQRQEIDAIVWQAQAMLGLQSEEAHVAVRNSSQRGATEILNYARDHPHFFWNVTKEIDRLGLNILGADIYTSEDGMALQIFYVQNQDGELCDEDSDIQRIKTQILDSIVNSSDPAIVSKQHSSRQHKSFDTPVEIKIRNPVNKSFSELHISTVDRPGLLANIVGTLAQLNINILSAFIATVSEQAEDVLHIERSSGGQLLENDQQLLRDRLMQTLDHRE